MSELIWLWLITVVTLALAAYAHVRIPLHTPSGAQALVTRTLLAGVGLLFGWVMAGIYGTAGDLHWWLVFLSGFGLVHVPAAAIVFLKGQRRAHG